jgi:hypothetical protein
MLGLFVVLALHALLLYLLLMIHADYKNGKISGSPITYILEKIKQVKKGEPDAKKQVQQKVVTKPSPKSITKPQITKAPEEERFLPPPNKDAPVLDMAEMLNAKRAARQQSEAQAAAENQAAQQGNRGLSPQERAEANVRHSMERSLGKDGEGGLFTILSKGTRIGSFSFRGWDPRAKSGRQVYEVDAGLHGSVELAIVKKMLEIIRSRFKGQAPWVSDRLGRTVMLSMAPQDNDDAERFLMKELFESDRSAR